MINPFRAQCVTAVYQNNLFTYFGEKQCICRRTVSSAYNCHGFSAVKHSVTSGTIGNSFSYKLFLIGKPQVPVVGTCCYDYAFCKKFSVGGYNFFNFTAKLCSCDLTSEGFCSELFRTLLHFKPKLKSVYSVLKAGVVFYL